MSKLNKAVPKIFMTTLLGFAISGCVQGGASQKGYARNDDCLFCHISNAPSGVRDVSRFYVNTELHHKTGVPYPLDAAKFGDYNQPTGQSKGMTYFDKNNNGQAEVDEIRLFAEKGAMIITCSSCHQEHERSPVLREEPDDDYLRGTNANSEMCTTCHRK